MLSPISFITNIGLSAHLCSWDLVFLVLDLIASKGGHLDLLVRNSEFRQSYCEIAEANPSIPQTCQNQILTLLLKFNL
jgi:hypothetical protein